MTNAWFGPSLPMNWATDNEKCPQPLGEVDKTMTIAEISAPFLWGSVTVQVAVGSFIILQWP